MESLDERTTEQTPKSSKSNCDLDDLDSDSDSREDDLSGLD
jgi:hypothetical protein